MANVAHAITRGTDRAEKFDGAHHDHKYPHGHGNRQRKHPDLPVWHHDSHREQDSVDRSRRSDRGNERRAVAMRIDNQFHNDVNKPRAHSAYEKINVELARPPTVLEVRAEHRQVQQVEKNVKNAVRIVQKNVSKWLPDSKPIYHRVRRQPDPRDPESFARFVKKQPGNSLQEVNRDAGDANRFDRARKIAAYVKSMPVAARKGWHAASVNAARSGVKEQTEFALDNPASCLRARPARQVSRLRSLARRRCRSSTALNRSVIPGVSMPTSMVCRSSERSVEICMARLTRSADIIGRTVKGSPPDSSLRPIHFCTAQVVLRT